LELQQKKNQFEKDKDKLMGEINQLDQQRTTITKALQEKADLYNRIVAKIELLDNLIIEGN